MNVFEDLLVELQEENLLEQTVIEEEAQPRPAVESGSNAVPEPAFLAETELNRFQRSATSFVDSESAANEFESFANGLVDAEPANEFESFANELVDEEPAAKMFGDGMNGFVQPEHAENGFVEMDSPALEDEAIHITADSDPPAERVQAASGQTHEVTDEAAALFHEPEPQAEPKRAKQPTKKDSEFFKKRAVAEVAGLQMVDHVLTGVEREYMKAIPSAFDDFNAKKALNAFLQATPESQAEAEFDLMQETELWCTALAARDAKVPVSSLRLYCENTKPVLSSQALLAVARFYRNLPYTETIRAKFDFVMTRLFSRPAQDGTRVCLFDRVESLDHINTLYAEWSSVPLYTADDDESKVVLTALSFEDLAVEAENAGSFDQLITSDFFGRLRLFKESIAELFFAPSVTSAAIEANVRIGNAYVVLIAREREKLNSDMVQAKYFGFDDQRVSDATGQSLQLVDILTRKAEPDEDAEPAQADERVEVEPEDVRRPARRPEVSKKIASKKKALATGKVGIVERIKENARNVNGWFLIAAGVLVAASFGIYIWANYFSEGRVSTTGVAGVSVQVPGFSEHVKVSKLSNGTLYVHLRETWDAMPKKKRLDLLQQVYQAGESQGWERIHLITFDGKQAGFASATRLEVPEP